MASNRPRPRPDAIALLKQDHQEVEAMFSRFEGLGAGAMKTRRNVVDKVIRALSVHAGIEEAVFYPAVRARMTDADDAVLEAIEEHHLVKTTLAELERTGVENERFDAKVAVLTESVRHHVREEEKELFPRVRKAFTKAELIELADAMAAARSTVPDRPHPHAPDEPPANLVANAISAPLDAARDVAGAAARAVRSVVRADS